VSPRPTGGIVPLAAIVLPPDVPPGFPLAERARAKTRFVGGLRKRWVNPDGTILEWDYQHGRVEKYTRRGQHLGEFDAQTGTQTASADQARTVEP